MAIKSPKLDIGVYLNGMTAPRPIKDSPEFWSLYESYGGHMVSK